MVEDMLKNSELSVQEMDAVAVAAGPGSFTGLRIGVSACKGLAWALDRPCAGVSTLEAMAWPLAHLEGNIVCAMDARRQQIYNAVFRSGGGELIRLREDRAVSLEEAAAAHPQQKNLFLLSAPIRFEAADIEKNGFFSMLVKISIDVRGKSVYYDSITL